MGSWELQKYFRWEGKGDRGNTMPPLYSRLFQMSGAKTAFLGWKRGSARKKMEIFFRRAKNGFNKLLAIGLKGLGRKWGPHCHGWIIPLGGLGANAGVTRGTSRLFQADCGLFGHEDRRALRLQFSLIYKKSAKRWPEVTGHRE